MAKSKEQSERDFVVFQAQQSIDAFKRYEYISDTPQFWESNLEAIASALPYISDGALSDISSALRQAVVAICEYRIEPGLLRQLILRIATNEEVEQFRFLWQEQVKKKREITAEIKQGKFPYLVHARKSERTPLTPYLVGCYQDENGTMKNLYGLRYFRSQRNVPNDIILGGWNDKRRVNLLRSEWRETHEAQVDKGPYWQALPQVLRDHFDSGKILSTSSPSSEDKTDSSFDSIGDDLYYFSSSEMKFLGEEKGVDRVLRAVKAKEEKVLPDELLLLFYSSSRGELNGRTGVIIQQQNGELQPLVVRIEEKEFAIELKGCGKRTGGFGTINDERAAHEPLSRLGTMWRQQAYNEVVALKGERAGNSPLLAGAIFFTEPDGYEQGYVIRLTPSTIRASYSDLDCLPDSKDNAIVELKLKWYAEALVRQILSHSPRLHTSPHAENILIWGDNRVTFTDYSDFILFGDHQSSYRVDLGRGLTPKHTLLAYLASITDIPGYGEDKHKQLFVDLLQQSLHGQGLKIFFKSIEDEEVAETLWRNIVAEQVFRARQSSHFVPQSLLNYLQDKEHRAVFSRSIPTSAIQFIKRYNSALQALGFSSISQNHQILFDFLQKLNSEQLPEKDYQTEQFFYSLNQFINPILEFFDYETDILAALYQSYPSLGKHINQALDEINTKRMQVTFLWTNPQQLFAAIQDPSLVKDLVTMSYYQEGKVDFTPS